MTVPTPESTADGRLAGLRIVLSGSIPELVHWRTEADDRAILEFTRDFAALVFKHGGEIVHGCHPSMTPVLIRQAERHAPVAAVRRPLTLLMSDLWANSLSATERRELSSHAEFVTVPQVGYGSPADPDTRQRSLTALRDWLIGHGNLLVGVGGKLHLAQPEPGVQQEVDLAIAAGLPTVLVGGLGGRIGDLARSNRWTTSAAWRGEDVTTIGCAEDPAEVIGRLFAVLAARRDAILACARPWPKTRVLAIINHAAKELGSVDGDLQRRVFDHVQARLDLADTPAVQVYAAALAGLREAVDDREEEAGGGATFEA